MDDAAKSRLTRASAYALWLLSVLLGGMWLVQGESKNHLTDLPGFLGLIVVFVGCAWLWCGKDEQSGAP